MNQDPQNDSQNEVHKNDSQNNTHKISSQKVDTQKSFTK